ncbi:hypothetical protein C8Q77DRAFT_469089 [Trametes polyzona]|nr:hypothetical protein C8Q77DRAFT_469089 [Trametes polyzona]
MSLWTLSSYLAADAWHHPVNRSLRSLPSCVRGPAACHSISANATGCDFDYCSIPPRISVQVRTLVLGPPLIRRRSNDEESWQTQPPLHPRALGELKSLCAGVISALAVRARCSAHFRGVWQLCIDHHSPPPPEDQSPSCESKKCSSPRSCPPADDFIAPAPRSFSSARARPRVEVLTQKACRRSISSYSVLRGVGKGMWDPA